MSGCKQPADDVQVEQVLGNLLRIGVIASAVVVLAGGVIYLARHGSEPAEHRVFRGEPVELRSPSGIVHAALAPVASACSSGSPAMRPRQKPALNRSPAPVESRGSAMNGPVNCADRTAPPSCPAAAAAARGWMTTVCTCKRS